MTKTPAENGIRGMFRVCGKTGRIVGLNLKNRWAKWLFPIAGLLALAWYLLRVLPKPSRAAYPCQQVAAPLALGSVVYWLSLLGVLPAFRQAKRLLRENRYSLAGVCLAAALVCGAIVLKRTEATAKASTNGAANAPIGVAQGINPGRVAWSHDASATLWSGNSDGTHWWDPAQTNQSKVDAMLSSGLQSLTGATSDAAAWDALFRSFNQRRGNGNIGYAQSPNQIVAIKINQNPTNQDNKNYYAKNGIDGAAGTSGNEYAITANPHLILSLVKQLVAANVEQANIIVTDPTGENRGWGGPRTIGDNIYTYVHAQYPGVRFVDGVGLQGRELAAWPGTDSINYTATISGEASSKGKRIAQQILNAGFLIDMAILKDHGDGPTLTFKNFYGAIDGQRHGPVFGNGTPTYYSNLIPLMGNSNLGGKTMLFMIDGLYGAPGPNSTPVKWKMSPFNGAWPSSVFLSQDPCAIDSVGFDFLNTEFNLPQNSDYYIHEAAAVPGANGKKLSGYAYQADVGSGAYVGSLGVEEHWNNSTAKQYSRNLKTGNGIELVSAQSTPTTKTVAFEAESLAYTATGATAAEQTDTNASGGHWIKLLATAAGPYMQFTLPNIAAGTYQIQLTWKGLNDRGILSLSVDGTALGGTLNQYSAASAYSTTTFGTVALAAGSHTVRLTATGKGSASSSYALSADKFTLVQQ